MKKIVPKNAHLIPREAKCVFKGKIFSVYQWQQKLFDSSYETFEMLKRPDIGIALAVKDNKFVIVKQLQPQWSKPRYTLPGGRAEEDETGLQTAQRETLEETGIRFKDWKLLEVIQNYEKIESFLYVYIATDPESEVPIAQDAGEKIEVELIDFEKVVELSKTEPRLEGRVLSKFKSMNELLAAPEFQGREIDF